MMLLNEINVRYSFDQESQNELGYRGFCYAAYKLESNGEVRFIRNNFVYCPTETDFYKLLDRWNCVPSQWKYHSV